MEILTKRYVTSKVRQQQQEAAASQTNFFAEDEDAEVGFAGSAFARSVSPADTSPIKRAEGGLVDVGSISNATTATTASSSSSSSASSFSNSGGIANSSSSASTAHRGGSGGKLNPFGGGESDEEEEDPFLADLAARAKQGFTQRPKAAVAVLAPGGPGIDSNDHKDKDTDTDNMAGASTNDTAGSNHHDAPPAQQTAGSDVNADSGEQGKAQVLVVEDEDLQANVGLI